MTVLQKLRIKVGSSRRFAVCVGVVLAFVIDLVFWIFIQDVYKLSDFIVTILSGITVGLFSHEMATTYLKKENKLQKNKVG